MFTQFNEAENHHFSAVNGNNLWYQTFGNREAKPLLLMNGGGPRASMWPQAFCEMLASHGFFVIRYDHRGSGYSSATDQCYDLKILAEDASCLINNLGLNKVNVVGASMGGWIAMLLAALHPEKIISLTCMITGDLNSFLNGTNDAVTICAKPKASYLSFLASVQDQSKQDVMTIEDKIQFYLACWKICNGDETPFDENLFRSIIEDAFFSANATNILNQQMQAMQVSNDAGHLDWALPNIKLPTLIIQGMSDPIFLPDHGEYLKKRIANAKLEKIAGMGHVISPFYYETLVEKLEIFINEIYYC